MGKGTNSDTPSSSTDNMRTSNILKVTLATVMLSSCGLFKNYERPADINADGIYGDVQSGGEQGLGDIKWREIFTDPQLQSLIEKGLTNNTDMKNADLKIQEVQYALKCAKLAYFPNIYFNPSGTVSKTFKIVKPSPPKTSVKKLRAKSSAFFVKWKKVSGISGYQIQYSTNKKFKGAKKVFVNSKSAVSKTVKNLKSQKVYYVRVRTYKTVNKTKYFSSWSRYKSVKTR